MAGRLAKDEISSDNFKYRSSRRHDHWDHVWLRNHHAGTDSAHQYRGNLPSGRSWSLDILDQPRRAVIRATSWDFDLRHAAAAITLITATLAHAQSPA
jgi:hypothetical protein